MSFQFRLVNPATGLADTILPDHESWEASPVFCDVGAVRVNYPQSGKSATSVAENAELALFLDGVELPDCRFIIEDTNGNEVSEAGKGRLIEATGRTMLAAFEDAVVYPKSWPTVDDTHPAEHDFTTATAGTIMSTLIQRAQTRGALTGITYASFAAATDSTGAAWTKAWSIAYSPGVTYLQVLQNLVDAGMCEIRMVGRDLRMYNPGTLGTDKTVIANPVILRRGKEITEAPKRSTARELRNAQLIAGANGNYQEVTDGTSIGTYGRRESYQSQQNVADSGTLLSIAQIDLDLKKQPRVEKTHAIAYGPNTVLPLRDFALGDWVYSDTGTGLTRYRVRQVVLSGAADGTVSSSVVLNDIIAEREVEMARKVAGIVGGSTVTGASNTTDAPPDVTVPNAPASCVISSSTYTDAAGNPHAQMTVSWSAVTQNTDSTAITDLAGYEVQWWYNGGNVQASTVVDSGVTAATFSPILLGAAVRAHVRAFDTSGHYSTWSTLGTATTTTDTGAPPVPSTPTLVARVAGLQATWDGLGSVGEAMPADFSHVEVHCSAAGSGFTPNASTLVDILVGPGASPIGNLAYATTYYVKFISVDKVGNKSAASAAASGVPVKVTAPDLNITIGAANLISNSSFENGHSGWNSNNAFAGTMPVVGDDATHIHSGVSALKVTGTPTAGGTGYTGVSGPAFTLPAGDYVASAWVYATVLPGASGFGIVVTASKVSNPAVGALSPPGAPYDFIRDEPAYVDYCTTLNQWVRITTRFHITEDANVQLFVVTDGAETEVANFAFWVDDVQLEAGSLASAYAPKPGEILPGTITSTELAALSVITSKLADGAVTSGKVEDSAITAAKLSVTIGGSNLLADSSFESGTVAGWDALSNCTIANSTTKATHGTKSLRVTSVAAGDAAPYSPYQSKGVLPEGTKVVVSAWVISTVTTTGYMRMQHDNPPGTGLISLQNGASVALAANIPTRILVAGTVPVGGGNIRCEPIFQATGAGQVFYVDAVQLEIGDVATAYAPMPDEILPSTITGTEIANNVISTAKLVDGAVTAVKAGFIIGGGNLLSNSGFESGAATPDSWSSSQGGTGAVFARDTGTKRSGAASAKLTKGTSWSFMGQVIPLYGTSKVTVSAYIYIPSGLPGGDNVHIVLRPDAGTGYFASTAVTSQLVVGSWVRVKATFSPDSAAATSARVDIGWEGGTAGGIIYVDQVQAEFGDVVTAYAPKPDEILPSTITATEIADNAVTTPKLVAGAVVAAKIAANTITAAQIAAGTITATEIAALTITGAKIAAGAISAEKLTIGAISGPNLIINGGFDEVSSADATLPAKWVRWAGSLSLNATPFGIPRSPYSFDAGVAAGSTEQSALSYGFPVSGLKTYYMSHDYITNVNSDNSAPTAGKAEMVTRIIYYDREISSPYGNGTATVYGTGYIGTFDLYGCTGDSAWHTLSGQFTPPANAKWAQVHLVLIPATAGGTNYFTWDNLVVREVQVSASIADGAITTPKLVAGAVTAAKIAADTITANEIAANAITASEIAANAVTAEKLTIGALSANLLANPSFEDAASSGTAPAGWQGTGTRSTTAARSGNYGLLCAPTSGTVAWPLLTTPAAAGEIFALRGWARKPSGTTAFYFRLSWLDASNAVVSYNDVVSGLDVGTTWNEYVAQLTAPANTAKAQVEIYNYVPSGANANLYVDDVDLRRVVISAQIKDGAITTAKLVANAITTNELNAGAVTAAKIASHTITANEIFANTITANEIASQTITASRMAVGALSASNIETGTLAADITLSARIKTANTGARVELNSAGLKVYDSSNVLVVDLSATGSATFKGSISSGSSITGASVSGGTITGTTITGGVLQTAASGARLKIDSALANQIAFYSGAANESNPGQIIGETGAYSQGSLGFYAPTNSTATGASRARITMEAGLAGFDYSYILVGSDLVQISGKLPGLNIERGLGTWGAGNSTSPAVQISEASDSHYSLNTWGFAQFDGGVRSTRMRPVTQGFDSSAVTTTSTTFATNGANVELTFVAPPSGAAMVVVGGQLVNGAAGNQVFLGFEVRNTNVSGSVVVAASDNNALESKSTTDFMASMVIPISGLTPGNTYYARALHRVTAGTGTLTRRRLNVIPMM